MKCFLEAIREQKIPTDLLDVLDQANVRFYEGASSLATAISLAELALDSYAGCLIVEVHDHRSLPPPVTLASALASTSTSSTSTARYPRQQLSFALANMRDQPNMAKAEVYRIVLSQNPATLWTDLAIQNERWIEKEVAELQGDGPNDTDDIVRPPGWTEEETVELESIILVSCFPTARGPILIVLLPASDNGPSMPLAIDSGHPSIQYDAASDDVTTAETKEILSHRGCGRGGWREREARTRREGEVDEDWRRGNQPSKGDSVRFANPRISLCQLIIPVCRFARLAFIQAYRERQANPPTIAPPAPPAAPAANSSVTSIRLTVNNPATGSRAVVPSTSHDDTRKRTKKKKISTGAATESDGTPGPPTTKRIKKSTHVISAADAADESFDKERAAAERKRVAGQKKRAELKASKEKKKKGDYMGPSSSKYSWAS